MRILVCSDSHAFLSFMRYAVKKIKPNGIIHLGDHYEDGQVLAQENPKLPFLQVPGNCDRYRCPEGVSQILTCSLGGVRFFLTHGHLHQVKTGIGGFLADARRANGQVALYGHTHRAFCAQEPDGLWVMNPGACNTYSGSVGLITIVDNVVAECRILTMAELDELEP